MIAVALVGDAGPSLALVQAQPDSPFGDILGWVIIFFVVVWPVIRGLLGNAASQRKKFEEQQQRAGRKPKEEQKRSRLDVFIEEMMSGQRAQGDAGDAEAHLPAEMRAPARSGTTVLEIPPSVPRHARSVSSPQVPQHPQASRPFEDFAGDPFDDSQMHADLVSEAALTHLRSEDDVEASPAYAPSIERLALSERQADTVVTGDRRVSALTVIHRGRTPWQAAFVLKEVLGRPGGLRSSDDPYR